MVNNATNINKMNNYLSPNIIEYNLKKNHTTYGIGNPCPGLGQVQKCSFTSISFLVNCLLFIRDTNVFINNFHQHLFILDKRLRPKEAALHPFLAPELPLAFLLSTEKGIASV